MNNTTETNRTSTLLTVSELTTQLKNLLESKFTAVQIQGEISNFKPNSSGHIYFDLKDAGAKIGAVMFRNQVGLLAQLPKEGDHVIVKGSLSLYSPHGRYQIVVQTLQLAGVGQLLLKLEELKKKLAALGWFDKENKKPLPKFPKRIGVITSPTGAVIRDIINVLTRRCKGFHLILNPVPVQGAEAAPAIAKAILEFNQQKNVDVLIVCRGGGSLEDLWPFNEEIVASAIFKSLIPIVSAVGHETDFTIADFVADVRAPTPSAAAEIVSHESVVALDQLKKTRYSIFHALVHLLKRYQERLKRFSSHPFFSNPYALTGPFIQRLDDLKKEIDGKITYQFKEKRYLLNSKKKEMVSLNPKVQLNHMRNRLKDFDKRLSVSALQKILLKKKDLNRMTYGLKALDPKQVLKRGYSILFAIKNNSVIVAAQDLECDDEVKAIFSDGERKLKVIDGRDKF